MGTKRATSESHSSRSVGEQRQATYPRLAFGNKAITGQDPDVFGGGLNGWRAVARRHLDYRYIEGPPFESYDANNNCNLNQDMFVWMSAPNANRRTCQLDKPYKFAYFNIMNQLMAADPNLPYVHQLALQQCSAASFRRPNPGSYISIRDLDTTWQQSFMQAYNGSCGVGTYRQGNERYPYTQGRPDIFLAKGQSVPSSPVGLKEFCGLQGSTPEETQYTATSPPGAYQVKSDGQITLMSSDDVRASADISDKIVRLNDFYSLTVAESGYSFAISLDALRTRPGFKGTINLQYTIVTDGKAPPPGTIAAEDPVNTAIFCLHCLEQCTNYCTPPLDEIASEGLRQKAEGLLEREAAAFEKEMAGRNAADARWLTQEKATKVISRCLSAKPEAEQALLSALINKLGDPSRKLASDASYLLGQLLLEHPAMKPVVVREVERFVFRPGLSDRARYYCVTFLNQLALSHRASEGGSDLAQKLINIYFSLRAFPYVAAEHVEPLVELHSEALFRLIHTAPFTVALQFLSLLVKAMRADVSVKRVAAFAKRLLQRAAWRRLIPVIW
eukprot:gene10046-10202_t